MSKCKGFRNNPNSKSFSTENASRTHIQSRKHRDRENAQQSQQKLGDTEKALHGIDMVISHSEDGSDNQSSEEEDIDNHIASARRPIKPTDCLFCPKGTNSIPDAVLHMARDHSFFIPDQEHLTDISGLISYLGEKIVIGNLCLYCPHGGKEFGSLDAVRRHMVDKAHCKVAYGSDEDRAELLDFYDYPVEGEEDALWEDIDMGAEDNAARGEPSTVSDARIRMLIRRLARCRWQRTACHWSFLRDGLSAIGPYACTTLNIVDLPPLSIIRKISSPPKLLRSDSGWPILVKLWFPLPAVTVHSVKVCR